MMTTALAVISLGIAGCASGPQESSPTRLLSYADVQAEYRTSVSSLPAPEGYVYPQTFDDEQGELYEVGFGRSRAVALWNCAWGKEWLRARTVDPDAAATALAQYRSVAETDVFRDHWDPVSVQEPFFDSIERAELGDPSGVQADVQANCP